MHIHYISESIIPSRFASSVHVMKMCQAFAQNGHTVELHAIKGDFSDFNTQELDDIYKAFDVKNNFKLHLHTHPKIKFLGTALGYSLKIKKIIQKQLQTQEIMPQDALIYGRYAPAMLLCANLNIPIIYESHAPPKSKIHNFFLKKLLKKAVIQHMVVISHALKRYFEEHHSYFTKDIIVAPDAADDPFEKNYAPIPNWKGRPNTPQIGYVGHLYRGRGIELILHLAGNTPQADFHIVGGTDDLVTQWKEKSKQLKNVFFHGFLPYNESQRYFLHFDIVLAPYQNKVATKDNKGNTADIMSPLKIFEYMSWGKPMLVSRLPALEEVLVNNKNALLCAPSNPADWQEKLELLLSSPDKKMNLGRIANLDFKKLYSWNSRSTKVI